MRCSVKGLESSFEMSTAAFLRSFLWCKIVFCFTRGLLQSFGFFSSKEGQLPMSSFRNLISTLVWDSNTELFSGRIVLRRNVLVRAPVLTSVLFLSEPPNPISAYLPSLIATSWGCPILLSTNFLSENNLCSITYLLSCYSLV